MYLVQAFKAQPLKTYTLRVVFFDLEETGLHGSQAFFEPIRGGIKSLPSFAANLDIFGYGDTFFVTASQPMGKLADAFQRASMENNIAVRYSPPAQYPSSDHRNMIAAGIETLGIALIDGGEIDAVLGGGRGQAPPKVLTIIHSPRDTIDVLKLADIERAATALERFVRVVDGTLRGEPAPSQRYALPQLSKNSEMCVAIT